MLAWVYRYRLLCHIIALFKQVLVYHREAFLEEFAVLVAYIKVEIGRACLLGFENDSMGYHISRSKFKALVIVMHEALLVAVKEVCALATYSLGNKEALTGSTVVECGRMELDVAEILYLSAHFISESDTVACSDSRVCGELINTSDTACSKDEEVAVHSLICIIRHFQESGVACGSLLGSTHQGILHNLHIRESLYFFEKLACYLSAC